MIEQVTSLLVALQHYIVAFCHFLSVSVKRLISVGNEENEPEPELTSNGKKSKAREKSKKLKPITEIPGPKCLPVVGSLFEFIKYGSINVHKLSYDRHKQYGPIFRERVLSQEMVFLSDVEMMKEWMLQEGKPYPASYTQEPSVLFIKANNNLQRGIFFRNGEEWYNLRKIGHQLLTKNAADFEGEGLFEEIEDFLRDYMEEMRNSVCKDGKEGVMTDFESRGYAIVVGATTRIAYGQLSKEKFKKLTGTDYDLLPINTREVNILNQKLLDQPAWLAKLFKTATWKEYEFKLRENLESCVLYGQKKREEILKNSEKTSMRTHGLLYKSTQLNVSTVDVDDILADFAIDAKDPFASTVMCITYLLAKYPDIQEKIFQEVCQVYPSNEKITYGKSHTLDYTRGFLMEALRLYPIGAFTARVALEDTVIGGYVIPPGTLIMYSTYAAHRDPKYFSDPEICLPERWLNSNGDKNAPTCEQSAFASFGLGLRFCIGVKVATSVLLMYLGNLVRKFKLRIDNVPDVHMRTVLYLTDPNYPIYLQVREEK